MLNALIPFALRLRTRFPRVYSFVVSFAKRFWADRFGVYPRPLGDEVAAVTAVLRSSQWNMTAGKGLVHERLEAAFADYIGVNHAVAVNTGGVALQMAMRAMGLRVGDEVIHQVDTCSATALAAIAAGCTPLFADISARTLMLDTHDVQQLIGPRTRAVIPTHMWGNPEDMTSLLQVARQHDLLVIEDGCLSLGASVRGSKVGSFGQVGVFSFGCIKPIQAGEGGMLVTQDEALARELRAMRHWGDHSIEYGVRDTFRPAWNGRMSEILAAVVIQQLKGYARHLGALREAVGDFAHFLQRIDGVDLVLGSASRIDDCAFSQVVLRIDENVVGKNSDAIREGLYARGVPAWHSNFEPINTLTLFRTNSWEEWLPRADIDRTRANYQRAFPMAQRYYTVAGLGLAKMNFLSHQNLHHLMKQIEQLCRRH
jgi:dTDP-4-amino-4,6-dideoxygalactose transaminase